MAMRVKIFIDFWNFQLAWNSYHERHGATGTVRIPWHPRLYEVLVEAIDPGGLYAGTHVFASFDPSSKKDLPQRGLPATRYSLSSLQPGNPPHRREGR